MARIPDGVFLESTAIVYDRRSISGTPYMYAFLLCSISPHLQLEFWKYTLSSEWDND
jgi:hypothetical protein